VRAPSKQEYLELRRRILAWQSTQLFGPPRGRDLVPCVDVMLGVGVRPNELLVIRWEDPWLDEDIPFILVTGTIAKDDDGKWHRQDWTKGDRDQVAKIQPIALAFYIVQLFGERKSRVMAGPKDSYSKTRTAASFSSPIFGGHFARPEKTTTGLQAAPISSDIHPARSHASTAFSRNCRWGDLRAIPR